VVTPGRLLPRALYGGLFVVGIPLLLVAWAQRTSAVIALPPIQSMPAGLSLALAGLCLVAAGGRELILRGHGLPMNAFPPSRLVRTGVYAWIRNPMYIGFGLACAGVSIATGSSSGLWLVTPVACLAAAALVYGFERQDILARLGPDALRPPRLSLPRGDREAPEVAHRFAVFVWVLIPWTLTWLGTQALGRPPDAFGTALPFEATWPVWQWTEAIYLTAYLFIPITALLLRTQRALRRFAVSGGVATAVVTLCWLTIPVVAGNRPFEPSNVWGRWLAFEQAHSIGVAAFPAFHVLWSLIAADALTLDGRLRGARWPGAIGWAWAVLISLSCLTTGMHTVIDALAAVLLFFPLRDPGASWERVRRATEHVANSWREWRIGPVRAINHGLYAAAAGGVGFAIIATAAGNEYFAAVVWVSLCVIAGAGIWAQFFEGSSRLLRPFGWYGGVAGGLIGAVTAPTGGAPLMPLLAACALAMPWIQAIGRLRCLVQGCCHGGPAPAAAGISYRHPRSRVMQIAGLAGRPIHATPLYSIAANVLIGVVLLRLRQLHAPDVMLLGLYLILAGIARFVEEAHRAEPQTPIVGGLHTYQWIAIASVLAGVWCTMLPPESTPAAFGSLGPRVLIGALVVAAIAGCAMGVDFPKSNRRFSRLAPAD
jgi:prolipoprotein diacylglyceryltransferase/protein-S-isoprenylcysteine O-methyltransferase Ste14